MGRNEKEELQRKLWRLKSPQRCSLLPFHERIREPSQTSTGWTHRINNQAWTTYLELCPVLSSTVLLAVRLHIPPYSPNFNKIASVSDLFYTYSTLTQYLLIQQSFWPLNLIWIFLAVWANFFFSHLFAPVWKLRRVLLFLGRDNLLLCLYEKRNVATWDTWTGSAAS